MRHGLPLARPGMRVGLLGGSFDPPHDGHVHLTREALRRIELDRVWWLVSPGNPLKTRGPASMADRMAQAARIMQHPRVVITDIEARIVTRHTARTLARLRALYPGVRFVWLMGADNLRQFHLWQDWADIARTVPIAVFARPDQGGAIRAGALRSRMAQRFSQARIPGPALRGLARHGAPAWGFVTMPLKQVSSSALRQGADPAQP